MKQSNPFAKLGALDQQLYQETTPKSTSDIAPSPINNPASPTPIGATDENKTQIEQRESLQNRTPDTRIPRHHDTKVSRYRNTLVSTSGDEIIENIRKAVKQIGKEPATQRLTLEEKQELKEIEYIYQKRGIKTNTNEIMRIAMNYIVKDYKNNGENSILAKVIKRLNS